MILQRTTEMRELHETLAVLQRFVLLCKTRYLLPPFSALKRSPLASPFIVPFKGQSSKIQKDSSESCPVWTTCGLVVWLISSWLKIKVSSPSHLSAFESSTSDPNCMPSFHVVHGKVLKYCFCHFAPFFFIKTWVGRSCDDENPSSLCWQPSGEHSGPCFFHSADEADLTLN